MIFTYTTLTLTLSGQHILATDVRTEWRPTWQEQEFRRKSLAWFRSETVRSDRSPSDAERRMIRRVEGFLAQGISIEAITVSPYWQKRARGMTGRRAERARLAGLMSNAPR